MTSNRKKEKLSSASLHNRNCYAYLRALLNKTPDFILAKLKVLSPILAEKLTEIKQQTGYVPSFPYADTYKLFFDVVEDNIKTLYDDERTNLSSEKGKIIGQLEFIEQNKQKPGYSSLAKATSAFASAKKRDKVDRKLNDLDEFINAIYANDNAILEQTYDAIKKLPQGIMSSAKAIEESITDFLQDDDDRVNTESQTPAEAGSNWGAFTALVSDDYKPQHTVSLATRRFYEYNRHLPLVEYRFGTQGQRHGGKARVSPLFEKWLEVQQRLHPRQANQSPINHVYINNLGYHREGLLDYAGRKERDLTHKLHELENRHENLAVITLPADTGLMSRTDYAKTEDRHDYQAVYDEFLQIASQDPKAQREVKDFYISDKVRRLLFADGNGRYSIETEKKHLRDLLKKSFDAMGIREGTQLSSAQRQAVWFDFIKFKLTNHITETLKPNSINFSCKDAIDRGGVSSAYFNLMKSFEMKQPLSREEFDRALHAAPAMVKARGMNHNLKLIWNAVDAYIDSNYKAVNEDPAQRWLIEWRDVNCPHERVPELLTLRIAQIRTELNNRPRENLDITQTAILEKGIELVDLIDKQIEKRVSGQRLLLDALILTPKLIDEPANQDLIQHYEQIADQLDINYPGVFNVIVGFMKAFVCFLLLSESLMEKGLATMRSGLEIETRKSVIETMKEQLQGLQEEPKIQDELNQTTTAIKAF